MVAYRRHDMDFLETFIHRQSIDFCFCFTSLYDWVKTRSLLHQPESNQNPTWLGQTRFPALGAGDVYFLDCSRWFTGFFAFSAMTLYLLIKK